MRSGLRLLRVASKLEGVKVVVVALRRLMPDLFNVLTVGLLFYYIFSVGCWCMRAALDFGAACVPLVLSELGPLQGAERGVCGCLAAWLPR